MTITELEKIIADKGLDKYCPIDINTIYRVPNGLSIVKENNAYTIYSCGERGSVYPMYSGLDESTACEKFLKQLEGAKSSYEYYQKQGTLKDYGYYW